MADTPDTERQAAGPDAGEVLSVTELNNQITSVIEETPALHRVRCIGEVTDLHQNIHRSISRSRTATLNPLEGGKIDLKL